MFTLYINLITTTTYYVIFVPSAAPATAPCPPLRLPGTQALTDTCLIGYKSMDVVNGVSFGLPKFAVVDRVSSL